jgi:hypothetical protein
MNTLSIIVPSLEIILLVVLSHVLDNFCSRHTSTQTLYSIFKYAHSMHLYSSYSMKRVTSPLPSLESFSFSASDLHVSTACILLFLHFQFFIIKNVDLDNWIHMYPFSRLHDNTIVHIVF